LRIFDKALFKDKLYRLYVITFSLLFSVHSFFQVKKAIYINMNSLNDKINAEQFYYLQRYSELSVYVEYIITAIFIIALMISIFDNSIEIIYFIKIKYILVTILLILSCVIAFLYNASIGNIIQPLVFPFTILTIAAVVRIIKVRRLNINHNN